MRGSSLAKSIEIRESPQAVFSAELGEDSQNGNHAPRDRHRWSGTKGCEHGGGIGRRSTARLFVQDY